MYLSKLTRITILTLSLASSGAAFAGGNHAQTHHCKLSDGTMDMKKTHKECTAAKGIWAKDAAKDPAKDATKDPAKDAPKASPPAPAPKK